MIRLSSDALDRLRGDLLAAREAWCGRLAEYEAMLGTATRDAFGNEIRALARMSIVHIRRAVADIDVTLARLVETYGSCEWCDAVIPSEVLEAIPPTRLCRNCTVPAFPHLAGSPAQPRSGRARRSRG